MAVEFRPMNLGDLDAVVDEYERTWGISDSVGSDASKELCNNIRIAFCQETY